MIGDEFGVDEPRTVRLRVSTARMVAGRRLGPADCPVALYCAINPHTGTRA